MDIKLRCPHCFLKIGASEEHKGTKVNCPNCNRAIKIPSPKYGTGLDVGGFVIEQWLGNGAMGEVHLATQTTMHRQVAIKILPNECIEDDEDRQRFIREVKTLANLSHPNIVSAISAGEFDGGTYLAMNFIDGMTVEDQILKSGPLDEKTALLYCEKLASALSYAWENDSLLHRDLKPANFMVDNNSKIHLMDLGIAKSMENDLDLTAEGIVMGTPYYMSPEQSRGEKKLDMRSDIYSLGASLYHMLTGVPPYDQNSSFQVMSKKLTEPPVPAEELNPLLSKKVCNLINRMMKTDLNKRLKNWQADTEEIQSVRNNTPKAKKISVTAEGQPSGKRKKRKKKKKKSTSLMLPSIFLAIIIVIIVAVIASK